MIFLFPVLDVPYSQYVVISTNNFVTTNDIVIPNSVNEDALSGPHLRAAFAREWADQRPSRSEGPCV
jgi:hypothetical protein